MPRVTVLHYYLLAGFGLALTFLGQHAQRLELANYLVLVAGVGVLATRRGLGPMLYLILLAFVQIVRFRQQQGMPFPATRLFEPAEMLLATGTLLFIGSVFRIQGMTMHVTPPDPRIVPRRGKPDRPLPPQTRSDAALSPEEIALWLVTIPVFVLGGELMRLVLGQSTSIGGLPHAFSQIVLIIWSLVVGILIVASIFAYWRRAHADAETARMHLQEVVWRETRRDLTRIGRWLAWWARRKKRSQP
jgi:hypothetical protein